MGLVLFKIIKLFKIKKILLNILFSTILLFSISCEKKAESATESDFEANEEIASPEITLDTNESELDSKALTR